MRGQHEDAEPWVSAEHGAKHNESIHPGHIEIERDEIGMSRRHSHQSIGPARSLAYDRDRGFGPEHPTDRAPRERGIVDHEDPNHAAASIRRLR
jgi:hypothetical protein